MAFPFPKKSWTEQERSQIRTLTPLRFISLLDKDSDWNYICTKGSRYIYQNKNIRKPYDLIEIHHHRTDYRNKSLVFDYVDHICWTKEKLKELKVIK